MTRTRATRIAALAAVIGLLAAFAAVGLLDLIRLFTNLFFFQTLSIADRSPAANTLGAWVIVVPVIGGLVVGMMARFGSDKIRGHGIPEAIEAILFGKSKMSAKVAVLKPLSSERLPVVADLASMRLAGLVARSDLVKPRLAHIEEEERRERPRRAPWER